MLSSPGKNDLTYQSIERVVVGQDLTRLCFSFPHNFSTERQIRYARKPNMHDIFFSIFKPFLISSAGSLLASKNIYCEKNTAIIHGPPRRVTALQVVRTLFLGPRPRLSTPPPPPHV